jgi:uncharacterized protein involved in response to NO
MLQIDEPAPRVTGGFALWALGFRPFYLLAAAFAALSVAIWVLQYAGVLPAMAIRGPVWHGHEMLFGYAIAVVAGFLFTAVRTWAQRPTPTGALLAAIALLWVAGRVLVLTPFGLAAAIVNALFPLAVAAGIAVPLVSGGNKRNYFFVALLAGASVAILLLHLSSLGIVAWPERVSLQAGLDIVLFIISVIAGRVLPMFTNNGVPGAGATRHPGVEKAALGSVLLLLAADVVGAPGGVVAVIALVAAVAHGARLALWRPWRTRPNPLVWVLHAAYAWVPIHLVLRALVVADRVPAPLATHALAIGVIGGMTIGMMTRTARGHTGRPLVADRFEVACYVLVQLAAIVRVLVPLAWPRGYMVTVMVAGTLWSAAFALYCVRYWPVLTRPRLDGKPG